MSNGDPELVQLLTPEGERIDHPDYAFVGDDEQIQGFYRDMVLTRRIDAEATALQRQGELGLWASCLGQEARADRFRPGHEHQDFVFPTYREHGVAWCLGVDPLQLLGLFRGVDLGGWDAAKTRFHLYTIVIGAQALHATGYAMGVERDGLVGTGDPARDTAVIGYFGDGATSQGDVNEAFIFASSYNAPIVFFCQNNQWAISEPIERQSRIPLYRRASGFGFPGVRVDGNDVLAVHAVTSARAGAGPVRQRADADRGVHLPDGRAHHLRRPDQVPAGRRARALAAEGPDRAGAGLPDPQGAGRRRVLRRRRRRGRRARRPDPTGLLSLPDPDLVQLFDNVYEEQTPYLVDQQRWYADYSASFEPATTPSQGGSDDGDAQTG